MIFFIYARISIFSFLHGRFHEAVCLSTGNFFGDMSRESIESDDIEFEESKYYFVHGCCHGPRQGYDRFIEYIDRRNSIGKLPTHVSIVDRNDVVVGARGLFLFTFWRLN